MLRKAENREEWRKLVVKSTVVPNGQPDYGIDKIRTTRPSSSAVFTRACLPPRVILINICELLSYLAEAFFLFFLLA